MIEPSQIVITRTEDHGTITLRGPHFALDLTQRDAIVVQGVVAREDWHSVIDDAPDGIGVSARLHVYGKERLMEIKRLVDRGLEEIARQERGLD